MTKKAEGTSQKAEAGPLRVALTGGIATGKSYCLTQFARLGVPVIDADVVAHEVLAPGTAGLAEARSRFGSDLIDAAGGLDRAAMATLVFADPAARRDLEGIVHPRVYRRIEEWFASLPKSSTSDGARPTGIADIPLLYETGREAEFDRVIVAACPAAMQRARLLERGFSHDAAERRLAAQMPIDEKRRRADYVIDTSGTTAETDRQVEEIWEQLQGQAGQSG